VHGRKRSEGEERALLENKAALMELSSMAEEWDSDVLGTRILLATSRRREAYQLNRLVVSAIEPHMFSLE
jgi:hypothetical protein